MTNDELDVHLRQYPMLVTREDLQCILAPLTSDGHLQVLEGARYVAIRGNWTVNLVYLNDILKDKTPLGVAVICQQDPYR